MSADRVTETVDALRREAATPSPAHEEAARLRAEIWARQHARDAARDEAACARAGVAPSPWVSLALRMRLGLCMAEVSRGAQEHEAARERREIRSDTFEHARAGIDAGIDAGLDAGAGLERGGGR